MAIDGFGDVDTRSLAAGWAGARLTTTGFGRRSVLKATDRLDPDRRCRVIYGSGLESKPELIARLGRDRRLAGNDPVTVAEVKSPRRLAERLQRLGIPHPAIRPDCPESGHWLYKKPAGSGGGGVRWPTGDDRGGYYQQYHAGQVIGLTVLADGRRGQIVGSARQWCETGFADRPFLYGGSMTLQSIDLPLYGELAAASRALVADTGLRGLCSIDFIVDRHQWWLLEVNPRPGASFVLHEQGSSAVNWHLAALEGRFPDGIGRNRGYRGQRIVYAATACRVPSSDHWPYWVSDRPQPGTVIRPGQPVCTVHAAAPTEQLAGHRLNDCYSIMQRRIELWPTP